MKAEATFGQRRGQVLKLDPLSAHLDHDRLSGSLREPTGRGGGPVGALLVAALLASLRETVGEGGRLGRLSQPALRLVQTAR